MKRITYLMAILFASVCSGGDYQVCFTPGEDCTGLIVHAISDAHQSVFVQAYSFTSTPIAKALVDAKNRGVDVKVVLDKSQSKANRYTAATFLLNNHIPTWIDYKPAIAHNKVMIIDKKEVITGSFNFTKAAQYRNAENVLIINNVDLAKEYLANWNRRQEQSRVAD
jgi:phosphatidylserine/phosphatidylglycerophosphate/cardiolipin synthase-like enzyme